MKLDSLASLFIEEVTDIYSAEQQLVRALPKMAAAASDPKLKAAFNHHLEQTKTHVERLESIFARLEMKPGPKVCKAMKGLVEEGGEMIEQEGDPAVIDAGLIGAAQRVEHYEIAAYGCARTYAELLEDDESAETLESTLEEEKAADEALTKLAEDVVNVKAAKAGNEVPKKETGRSGEHRGEKPAPHAAAAKSRG